MVYIPPAAEREITVLLNEITDISNVTDIDEFTIARLVSRADKLMKTDKSGAYTALGALASIKGNADDTRKYHEKALLFANRSVNTLSNYASSLTHLRLYEEAFEISSEAFEKSREDLNLLELTINNAIFTGLFSKADYYLDIWNKQSPDKSFSNDEFIKDSLSLVEKNSLDEASLKNTLFLLTRMPLGKNIRSVSYFSTVVDNEIVINVSLNCSPKDAVDLNVEFADTFLSNSDISEDVKKTFTGLYHSSSEYVCNTR